MSSPTLNLTGLAPAKASKTAAKELRPTIPVKSPSIIDTLAKQLDEAEVLEGSIKAIKQDLVSEVFEQWLALNKSSGTHNGTVKLSGDSREVKMTFKGVFAKVDATKADAIKEAVGERVYEDYFRNKIEVKVAFDKVPEDKQQGLIDGLVKLMDDLKLDKSLLELSNVVLPIDGFNEVRAKQLTVGQNLRLEQVQKTVVQFSRVAKIDAE